MVAGGVESELLHTYVRVDPLDVLILCVRLAVLVAVILTVPVVLFPVIPPLKFHTTVNFYFFQQIIILDNLETKEIKLQIIQSKWEKLLSRLVWLGKVKSVL